ncbi:MAG: putative DEAD-box ATP-dependent RNA helicase 11, partial [Streblomastix strix]
MNTAPNPTPKPKSDVYVPPYRRKQIQADDEEARRIFSNSVKSGINFDKYDDIKVQVSGNGKFEPIQSFQEINLGVVLNQNVKLAQYQKPTPIQKHALPIALSGRDLMACAQTGSGKTCAFLFPILYKLQQWKQDKSLTQRGARDVFAMPMALILAPTRELCIQIFDEATKFSFRLQLVVSVVYGGKNMQEQIRALKRSGCDLLVATPGRLIDHLEKGIIGMEKIQIFCLDEADRMLDMGFEEQIRKIVT